MGKYESPNMTDIFVIFTGQRKILIKILIYHVISMISSQIIVRHLLID